MVGVCETINICYLAGLRVRRYFVLGHSVNELKAQRTLVEKILWKQAGYICSERICAICAA